MKGAQEVVTSGDNDNDRLQVVFREVDSFLSGEHSSIKITARSAMGYSPPEMPTEKSWPRLTNTAQIAISSSSFKAKGCQRTKCLNF